MNYSLFALGLGFLLGLKHATEADHLVAVTTIVSEQRSVARSALVGAMWGVGSIGGMMLMSALISLPFVFTASRFARVDAPIRLLTGLLSVAFGIYYAWETTGGL